MSVGAEIRVITKSENPAVSQFEFLFLYGLRFLGAYFKKYEAVISNRDTTI